VCNVGCFLQPIAIFGKRRSRNAGSSASGVDRGCAYRDARVYSSGNFSGVRVHDQFLKLRDHLRAFPDETLRADGYEKAAEFFII
jgi:hypothetical protein